MLLALAPPTQNYLGADASRGRRSHLEEEDRILVALGVQGDVSGRQHDRCRVGVKTRKQGESAEVARKGYGTRGAPGGFDEGCGEIRLCLARRP